MCLSSSFRDVIEIECVHVFIEKNICTYISFSLYYDLQKKKEKNIEVYLF